jgi:hypothetical protein
MAHESKLKLSEIAKRIAAHLERIEADPKLNNHKQGIGGDLYRAGAYQGGKFVRVTYVSFQGASSLTRDDALKYLAWLNAGKTGTHWEQQRVQRRAPRSVQ